MTKTTCPSVGRSKPTNSPDEEFADFADSKEKITVDNRKAFSDANSVADGIRGIDVTITGLVSKPELNGRAGQAIEFLPDQRRFRVFLSQGKSDLSVKPSNVVCGCRDDSDGAAFQAMAVRGKSTGLVTTSKVSKGELILEEMYVRLEDSVQPLVREGKCGEALAASREMLDILGDEHSGGGVFLSGVLVQRTFVSSNRSSTNTNTNKSWKGVPRIQPSLAKLSSTSRIMNVFGPVRKMFSEMFTIVLKSWDCCLKCLIC